MNESQIGPYRVIRKLGEGGMGAVFEAIHTQIERRVAIKVLHPEFARNTDITARFFNEARAVNRVDHLGLVQISDYGQMPDGSAYIVMEYLKGESLGSRLKRLEGPMAVIEVLTLSRQIADALAAAHEKEIVHRDLKPDNIMIIPDSAMPGGERTKLLDFGIAKLAAAADQAHLKTRTNTVMGTPVFMSPEQCRGAAGVDDKSDVYSFGVMLYVMLSGRLPFDGEGTGEIMAKHIYEEPPPLGRIATWVPAPLLELVHVLLAKDKQHRPKMHQVVAALDSLIEQEGGRAPRRSSSGIPLPPRPTGQNALLDRPSTLGSSVGQFSLSAASRRRLLFAMVMSGVLGAGLLTVMVRRASPPVTSSASPAAPAPTPKSVKWNIRSLPSGAEVVRLSDNQILGQTPWQTTEPVREGEELLGIRKAGYEQRNVALSRNADASLDEALTALPPVKAASGTPAKQRGKKPAAPKIALPVTPAKPPTESPSRLQRSYED